MSQAVPRRILIAEDDRASRMLLANILRRSTFEVIEADTGTAAWQILDADDGPSMAILDWVMPGLDGIEIVRRVRERSAALPPYLIVLSSREAKSDVIAGLDAGANDYLIKPFHPGELLARVHVGRRMVELQEALLESQQRLSHLAVHDPLTGLLNRRAILERLETEIVRAQREGGSVVVGMCDVDHFKHINDTFGHQAGDDVLCWIARHLQSQIRKHDAVGRLGGEEFLVVTPVQRVTALPDCFQRICSYIAQSNSPTRSGVLPITLSIGVARALPGQGLDDVISRADLALYQAKREGRNRVVLAPNTPVPEAAGALEDERR